jgi:hypothetical protein
MAVGLLCATTKVLPAFSCSPDSSCAASAIDGFFLPLITSSLGDSHGVPLAPPSPASARRVTIIPEALPDKPPPVSPINEPMQRLAVTQTLVAGSVPHGGEADMFFELLPGADPERGILPAQATLPGLTLMTEGGDPGILVMTRIAVLPTDNAWPLQSLSQPVTMQITCGACGPNDSFLRFDGTGRLEMQIKPLGEGRITDIDLRGAGGQTAHGEMEFTLHDSNGNVLTADLAMLRLAIDQDRMDLATRLLLWRGARQMMEGAFIGTPTGDSLDKGAFAGQFSGAGCVPVCGVEN